MNLTARRGMIAAVLSLGCAGVLVPAAALASSGSPARALVQANSPGPLQQRTLAETTLPHFRVVLRITRPLDDPAAGGTVVADGYRPAAHHKWKLSAAEQVGLGGAADWYSEQVCSFEVTQWGPVPASGSPAMVTSDSMTVSLSPTPAIGCGRPVTRHWR
jgi:hypothetical protein